MIYMYNVHTYTPYTYSCCRSMLPTSVSHSLVNMSQDHQRGLPNIFGGICVNTWGQALCSLDFIEAPGHGGATLWVVHGWWLMAGSGYGSGCF